MLKVEGLNLRHAETFFRFAHGRTRMILRGITTACNHKPQFSDGKSTVIDRNCHSLIIACSGMGGGRPVKTGLKDKTTRKDRWNFQPIELVLKWNKKQKNSIYLHLFLFTIMCTRNNNYLG